MFQNGAGPAIMRSSPVAVRRVARVGAAGAPIASSPTSRSGGARGVRKGKGKASLWDEPTTTSRTSLTKLGGAGDGTGTRTSVLSSAALQQHYSAAFGIGDLNGGSDSKRPCCICQERFGVHQQVLLSCTHVFHRACLRAFEQHSGVRSCPLCRKEDYQARLINDGITEHVTRAAIVIQAAYRGYRARRIYGPVLAEHIPVDPKLRQKFYNQKVANVTATIVADANKRANALDLFLQELDTDMVASKATLDTAHNKIMSRPLPAKEWDKIEAAGADRLESGDCVGDVWLWSPLLEALAATRVFLVGLSSQQRNMLTYH
eukprot:gene17275-7377_t